MKPRMLCTECFVTAEADTVLEGSDLLELLGWCCFAIPGLLYCWWRHALRIKVCPSCGGSELVREARAARARWTLQAPRGGGPRVRSLCDPLHWPRALATPRDRLRHGGVAALLTSILLGSALAAAVGSAIATLAAPLLDAVGTLLAAWIAYQGVRVARAQAGLPGCRAWDECGRPLRIEQIS